MVTDKVLFVGFELSQFMYGPPSSRIDVDLILVGSILSVRPQWDDLVMVCMPVHYIIGAQILRRLLAEHIGIEGAFDGSTQALAGP